MRELVCNVRCFLERTRSANTSSYPVRIACPKRVAPRKQSGCASAVNIHCCETDARRMKNGQEQITAGAEQTGSADDIYSSNDKNARCADQAHYESPNSYRFSPRPLKVDDSYKDSAARMSNSELESFEKKGPARVPPDLRNQNYPAPFLNGRFQ